MQITFDPEKRERTLRERGLDFEDAPRVFAGPSLTFLDDRFDYPETRFVTAGFLAGRMVIVVWTPDSRVVDGEAHRIISMRKANAREQARYSQQLGQAGRHH